MPPLPGTETILVVDDEHTVLSLANAMLMRYGYTVITAPTGKEALRLLEVWPDMHIDLALIDLVMPEMSGVQLAERIRELRPDLEILYFSAYSDLEPIRPKFARNVPFISKPFSSIQLTKRIREVLDQPKTSAAGEGE